MNSSEENSESFYDKLIKPKNLALLLALITVAAFFSALFCSFVHFDDQHYILENPLVINGNFKEILTSLHYGLYKPVPLLFFALEYKFFGANAFVFHFNNILFHILNAALMFVFLFKLSKSKFIAFFAALFFAVHPLRVESVAWIAERKDVLYLFFMLLGFITYLNYKNTASKAQYWLSVSMMCLSLLTKPMAVVFPLMLILADYYKDGIITFKKQFNKIPYFIVSAVFTVVPLLSLANKTINIPQYGFGAVNRLLVPFYDVYFYILKTAFPFFLSHYYDYPNTIYPLIAGAAAGFIIIIAVYFWAYKRPLNRRDIVFGFTLFLLSILPVSGIVSFHGTIAADRYTYFAQTGLFFILFSLLLPLWQKAKDNISLKKTLLACIAAFFVICFALTTARIQVWRTSFTLWANTVKNSYNSPNALSFTGSLLHRHGMIDDAINLYTKALEIKPGLFAARFNRANLYGELSQFNEALADFEVLIKDYPSNIAVRASLCTVLIKLGRYNEALEYAKYLPKNTLDTLSILITCYWYKGDYKKVKELYSEVQAINPAIVPPGHMKEVLDKIT